MSERPTLRTARLVLRPFDLRDAPRVQHLAGDPLVAATTLNIPHPYGDGVAETWIGGHQERFEQGQEIVFAITRREDGVVIGAIGLIPNLRHDRAELGYWIGVPYWGKGYCTEAAYAVVAYGFNQVGLNRMVARHFANNPASGRVMQKLGMQREGVQRQHDKKDGGYLDVVLYGLLRDEYQG